MTPHRRMILAVGLLAPVAARADAYPSRPVSLIAPFAPGASADGVARIVGEGLSAKLGAPFVVDNRPGAGGTTGLIALARATADGYTLGVGATGALVVNPHIPSSSAGFEPLRELAPISKLIDIPLVIVAGAGAGLRSITDAVAASKTRDGGLSYGSTGVNSSQHLAVELLKRRTGARLVHVAYRGSAPAMTDVLGGQIPLASVDLTSAMPHIQSGAVVPLAVTSARRVSFVPDVPTVAETVAPGFEVPAWIGLFGPARLPPELTGRLAEAVAAVLSGADARRRVETLACVVDVLGPERFAAFLERQSAQMAEAVRATAGSGN